MNEKTETKKDDLQPVINVILKNLKLLQKLSGNVEKESKGLDHRNEVTEGDVQVEDNIKSELNLLYPEYKIYGEESGGELSGGKMIMIDAIDGTSNFARRIPLYSTVVSFVENLEPVSGVIVNPSIFFGDKPEICFYNREGVFLNGEKVTTSREIEPKNSFALVRPGRDPKAQDWSLDIISHFTKGAVKKVANFGSSAYDLSLLASGRVEVVIYGTMTTSDIAGAIGMVRAAGGEVYDKNLDPVTISTVKQPVIAVANRELLENLKPDLFLDKLK